jgi:repressor LexA
MTMSSPVPILTERQKLVYDFILKYFRKHHVPPTFREICSEVGIESPNGASGHIRALAKKGFIGERILPGQGKSVARGIYVKVVPGEDCPMCGEFVESE